jgi:hypothetical protein
MGKNLFASDGRNLRMGLASWCPAFVQWLEGSCCDAGSGCMVGDGIMTMNESLHRPPDLQKNLPNYGKLRAFCHLAHFTHHLFTLPNFTTHSTSPHVQHIEFSLLFFSHPQGCCSNPTTLSFILFSACSEPYLPPSLPNVASCHDGPTQQLPYSETLCKPSVCCQHASRSPLSFNNDLLIAHAIFY